MMRPERSFEDSRLQQLESLCQELAGSRAKLSLFRHEKSDDMVAIVEPYNAKAAKIDLRLELEFGVYLLLGRASPFEVPFKGGYYTRSGWLDEVRDFCIAVIAGNFQEKLILVRGEVKGSDHQLELPGGKKIIEHWRGPGIIAPWTRKEVQLIRYEPY